ncbi:hypothetical protein J4E80_002484 [Alternaria sp. BMP 0032]|nr:hypothetical protein J4E80_002484 [Alternaria sp. BMP 0032]
MWCVRHEILVARLSYNTEPSPPNLALAVIQLIASAELTLLQLPIMAKLNALVPPSIWQAPPAQTDNVGMNGLQTKFQENEPEPREFWLPEPYKTFLEESEKRYAQQEAEEAAAKEHQRELETRESDHEKVMRHLKLDFRIQVDGLKRENEELQITIDAFHMLFDKIRDKNTAEIQALTQAMELLQGEVRAKAKELKIMYDAHDSLVKKLEDERAELPKKLADSAKNALALQSNAPKSSDKAVVAKGLALVNDSPYYLHG